LAASPLQRDPHLGSDEALHPRLVRQTDYGTTVHKEGEETVVVIQCGSQLTSTGATTPERQE